MLGFWDDTVAPAIAAYDDLRFADGKLLEKLDRDGIGREWVTAGAERRRILCPVCLEVMVERAGKYASYSSSDSVSESWD